MVAEGAALPRELVAHQRHRSRIVAESLVRPCDLRDRMLGVHNLVRTEDARVDGEQPLVDRQRAIVAVLGREQHRQLLQRRPGTLVLRAEGTLTDVEAFDFANRLRERLLNP